MLIIIADPGRSSMLSQPARRFVLAYIDAWHNSLVRGKTFDDIENFLILWRTSYDLIKFSGTECKKIEKRVKVLKTMAPEEYTNLDIQKDFWTKCAKMSKNDIAKYGPHLALSYSLFWSE